MTGSAGRQYVHIERLVLHGLSLSRAEQERLRQRLTDELTSRHDADPLGEQPTRSVDVHPEPTRAAWSPGDDPARLGQILGEAIHRSIRP